MKNKAGIIIIVLVVVTIAALLLWLWKSNKQKDKTSPNFINTETVVERFIEQPIVQNHYHGNQRQQTNPEDANLMTVMEYKSLTSTGNFLGSVN